MNTDPRITIVTPSLNQGRYLESTIMSVLGQKYENLEYFIMDGGSSDNSIDIIKKYSDRLSFWRSAPDRGQAAAVAEGFARATGDLLAWINADDVYTEGALHAFASAYSKDPEAGLYVGATVLIDDHGVVLRNRFGLANIKLPLLSPSASNMIKRRLPFFQPATMWTRAAYVNAKGIDTTMHFCFDRDVFIRLSLNNPGKIVPKIVSAYRFHEESKTSTMQSIQEREDKLLTQRYKHLIREQNGADRLIGAAFNRGQDTLVSLAFLLRIIKRPIFISLH